MSDDEHGMPQSLAPQTLMPTVRHVAAGTDIGRNPKRPQNEDTYLVREDDGLFAIFDGMGGMAAGEVASKLARDTFEKTVLELWSHHPLARLTEGLEAANQTLLAHTRQHPEHQGMGSTLVAVLRDLDFLYILSLGDSRLYHLPAGPGGLKLLTTDHSVAAELVATGELRADEVRHSPLRNQLLGCLGEESLATPCKLCLRTASGDRFLLCSDGVWDMLSDTEIEHYLRRARTVTDAVQNLIDAANIAGGEDNVTVIVLEIEGASHV